MVKYCKKCGNEVEDDGTFCTECGYNFMQDRPRNVSSSQSNPFNTYKIDMMDGEKIIRSSQIHIGCLYLPLIIFAFGILFGMVTIMEILYYGVYYYPGELIMCFFNIFTVIGIVWFIIRYIGYKNNDLILTNKRVFGKCGLISTTQMQSPLSKIDTVSFTNGIVGKIIGYGTVKISTTSSHFRFRYIRDGQTFYNDIFAQTEISDEENRKKDAQAIAEAVKNN